MKNNIRIDKNSEKIIIIGANGFLGSYLMALSNKSGIKEQNITVIASDLENSHLDPNFPFYRIDITNARNTIREIHEIQPDVVILTASMTDVDQCEVNKKLAKKVNIDGPKNVINGCEKTDSKLVFMSTDFVFDGTKEGGLYKETDVPNPLSYYASTKYKAELMIQNSDLDYLICRTAVLYGWNRWKLNFVTWIIDQLKRNTQLSIVTDQINSPTYVENLAEIILKLVDKNAKGIYHTAGDCALSRYEIALETADCFNLNRDLIQPTTDLIQNALRPENASLDISKLKSIIGSEIAIFDLKHGLNRMTKIKLSSINR